jgi:hypothetical protein
MPQGARSPREGSEMFARKSKRKRVLGRMEQVMPFGELLAFVEPHDTPLPGRMQACMARSWQRLRCGI